MWDWYIVDSLKEPSDENGYEDVLVAEATIPGDWKGCLCMESNKVKLFKLLLEALLVSFSQGDKLQVITDNESLLLSASLYHKIWLHCLHVPTKKQILVFAPCKSHRTQ